jgi:hypothetical protein
MRYVKASAILMPLSTQWERCMDKDSRSNAERIFLGAMGKLSNVEIAKKVGAHPITVGKWKKQDNWTAKLAEARPKATAKPNTPAPPKATASPKPPASEGAATKAKPKPQASPKPADSATPRKRTRKSPGIYQVARGEALKVYLETGGKISNEALGRQVGVSPASIASWKASDAWKQKLDMKPEPRISKIESAEVEAAVSAVQEMLEEAIEIDVDALTSPDHITLLNQQIDELLGRGHLSPTDLKTVAEAKEAVLRVVIAFLEIAEMTTEEE